MENAPVVRSDKSLPGPLYTAAAKPPRPSRVAFLRRAKDSGTPRFEELSGRVVRLAVEVASPASPPVAGEEDFPPWELDCFLSRYDADGNLVWRTRHGSAREAFWQAEFEYQLPLAKWRRKRKATTIEAASEKDGNGTDEKVSWPPTASKAAALPFQLTAVEDLE